MILDLNKIEKTLVRINKELKFEDIQKKNGLFLNGTLDSVKNRLKTKNTYNNKYQNKELNIYETYRWNYWMTLRYKNRKTEYNTCMSSTIFELFRPRKIRDIVLI